MGLYNRDYGRQSTPYDRIENPRSIVLTLIVINAICWIASIVVGEYQLEGGGKANWVIDWFALYPTSITEPWKIWQTLTYGFLHDDQAPWHLVFNMIGLFVFGRTLEQSMGRMEFLRFYLVSIIVSGAVAAAIHAVLGNPTMTVGASGGVVALTVLFAFKNPHATILFMMIAPVPAWLLASGYVALDVFRTIGEATGNGGGGVAVLVHLAGAAFAALYFKLGWKLDFLAPAGLADLPNRFRMRMRRAKLKVHDPDAKSRKLESEGDAILEKIYKHGEESLSSSERKTLERLSRIKKEKQRENG